MPVKKTSVKATKATKATKAKKTSASKKVEKPVEVETKVVEPTPVQEPVEDESYDAEFTELRDQLRSAGEIIKSLVGQVNRLEKRVSRDRKVMQKKMKGRVKRVKDPNAPLSGFAKPGPVSDELRKFLGLSKDELISRTQVTRKFTEYCKAHNLQNGPDKRVINPDKTVMKLLRLDKNSESLTFFNLQKYMKVHYPNKDGVYIHA